MTDEQINHLLGIDPTVLTPIVRQATQRERAELVDWQLQAQQGGVGDLGAGLVGTYRLSGHIRDEGLVRPWSLILKSTQVDAANETAEYLAREWRAYRSGFLDSLSGVVVAPKCFGSTQQPGDRLWIWLEDLGDIRHQPWTQDDFETTAHHFGVWNGSYLAAERRPDFPWFCHSTAREWMQQAAPEIEVLRASVEHPLIQSLYPEDQAQTTLRLWDERSIYLNALERLPQTICHNDAFRRNLFLKRSPDGYAQVVAIDWAYLGWGAVGEELAAMVVGNLGFNEVSWAKATEFTEALFTRYVQGLRQAGWDGDPRAVRLGFCAGAAMKYGFPFELSRLFTEAGQAWMDGVLNQGPASSQDESPGQSRRFIQGLAEEARLLIDTLKL